MKIDTHPVDINDLAAIAALIEAAFAAGIASHYSDEGRATFRSFATVERIRARLSGESEAWVAVGGDDAPLGYIEMTGDHLRMLFIRPDQQRRGIGRLLLEHVLKQRANRNITVNSAPNSDGFYLRMGFEPAGPTKEESGIVFIPMIRRSDPAPQVPQPQGSAHRR